MSERKETRQWPVPIISEIPTYARRLHEFLNKPAKIAAFALRAIGQVADLGVLPYKNNLVAADTDTKPPIIADCGSDKVPKEERLMRQKVANTLEQEAKGAQNNYFLREFYQESRQYKKILDLGPSITPTLIWTLRNKNWRIALGAAWLLDKLDWQPQSAQLEDQAFYYVTTERWDELKNLYFKAFPKGISMDPQVWYQRYRHAVELKRLDSSVSLLSALALAIDQGTWSQRINAAEILLILNSPKADILLERLTEDKDPTIRSVAKARLGYKVGYLKWQKARLETYNQTLAHPEWQKITPSGKELMNLRRSLLFLPPVGGKIPLAIADDFEKIILLEPSIMAEEQVRSLTELRASGKLGKAYIHQLTVQGRLPDRFKYVAVALILNSPYQNNWEVPFYNTPWGNIAPLVHDGATSQSVNLYVNPLWQEAGRTDFIQRLSLVHEPEVEKLEQLTQEERMKLPMERLVKARHEQEERERLLLETAAYQRLALALHATLNSTPKVIPDEIRQQLAEHWFTFEQKMNSILEEYDLGGVVNVRWFTDSPRQLAGWGRWLGLRYEEDWPPIQKELIDLENTRHQHPELRSVVTNLLTRVTDLIDHTIGLLPNRSD